MPGIGYYEIISLTPGESSDVDSKGKLASDTGRGILTSVTSVSTCGVDFAMVTDTDDRRANNLCDNTVSNYTNNTMAESGDVLSSKGCKLPDATTVNTN